MLKLTFYSFILATTLKLVPAQAQVQLNINLHHLNDMRVTREINCIQKNKDLIVSIEMETFQTEFHSFLRFELLDLNEKKSYFVTYNDDIIKKLTPEKPYTLQTIPRKDKKHKYILMIKNTNSSYCEKLQDSIQFTIEPA